MLKQFIRGLAIVLTVSILTTFAWKPPAARASGKNPFSDMTGHWAAALVEQATAAGYVSGYPDGTFRPNAPVTRAESVKLAVTAGRLSRPGPYPVSFSDVPDNHWVLTQGYLNTASYWQLLPQNGTSDFRPDEPATRLELLTMLLRLLGPPYDNPSQHTEAALPFTDIPESALGFVEEGLDLGLITGYPDRTFRPDGTVTRAEAVALIQRTLKVITTGDDESLHLVLNGKPVSDAVLSVRGGFIYVPMDALYLDSRTEVHGTWGQPAGPQVANDRFILNTGVVYITPGNNTAMFYPLPDLKQTMLLVALPYRRFTKVMMPVAPIGGKGAVPFGEAVHDPATGTISVTFGPDWPGFRLATRPDQVRVVYTNGAPIIVPGITRELCMPHLQDLNGYDVTDRENPPVTLSVDPAGPLRLQTTSGQTPVTSFTAGPDNGWQLPHLVLVPNPPEGSYALTISASSFTPATVTFEVIDPFPHTIALAADGVWKAGEMATLRISLLDRHGSPVHRNFWYHDYISGPPWTSVNPDVSIIGSDGRPVAVTPILGAADPDHSGYQSVIIDGVGTVTFTPSAGGSYHVKVVAHAGDVVGDLVAEGTFEVDP